MTAQPQQLELFERIDRIDRTHLVPINPLEFTENDTIPEEWECADCKEAIGFLLLDSDGQVGFEWVGAWVDPADDPFDTGTAKYCEDCLEYGIMKPAEDKNDEPITVDMLLDITDMLERLADRVVPAGNGRAEPFVARRLLIDAAAATRGAANQLNRFHEDH